MKEFIIRLFMISLIMCGAFMLGATILLPFSFGDENFPKWVYFVFYPMTLGLMAAFPQIKRFLDNLN